jgi:predicted nucleic acid-binding protein
VIDRVLIDAGPLVALFSEDDEHHERCGAALTALTPPLLTCWPVVTEAAWLLRKRPADLHNLFTSFDGGLLALLRLDAADSPAVAALMRRYESAGLQFADATLAHLAEREKIRTVFTTDRRDFSILRLKRNRTLRLIPDLA